MRMSKHVIWAALLVVLFGFGASRTAAAQDGQFLMPEESAAKAKQLLQQAIVALGGNTYLNVHNSPAPAGSASSTMAAI